MASESEVTIESINPDVALAAHVLFRLRNIGVNDHRSVQFDLHPRSLNGNFLVVPLANRSLITAMSGDHSVNRAVILSGIES